jgi:hypothetical protein
MRGKATWLAVAAVVAVALAAGLDALRGEPTLEPAVETRAEPPAGSPATTPVPHAPATGAAFAGTLYYTDESCELRALDLSDSTPAEAPNWDECSFVLSPDGRRVSGEGSGWDPYSDTRIGRVFQSGDGLIQVSTNRGPEGEPFAGEAPAWKPDGTLTYFADGAVREWPSGDAVLSQRKLLQELRRSSVPGLAGFSGVRVREAAWLDQRRLVAILSVEGPSGSWDMLTSFEDGAIQVAEVETPGRFADLRASPGGAYFAARRGQDGLIMAEPDRGEVDAPSLVGYRTIAWSPDDRWAAVATDAGVLVFQPGAQGPPELEFDLDARDLGWRRELGPDAVSGRLDTTEASAWLAGVGVGGRLYVTQQEGGSCRLRALEIPGLEWADAPDVPESPCRFAVDANGNVAAGGVPGIASTPGGRPTYVADGELFAGEPGDRTELLLSAAKLEEILGNPAALEEVAWLDEERFWAVVRSEGADGIALMSTDALVYSPWFAAPRIEGLRVTPAGMVAASSDRGVAIFDGGGRRRLIYTNGRDVDWAPGELIAAVSTRDGLLFVAPVTGETVSLPLEVADLEWVTG